VGRGYQKHLIVFTRYPEPGKTKTRLVPVLGKEGAANLQRKMTEHTLFQAKRFSRSHQLMIEVRHDGGDEGMMRNWLGPDFVYRPQGDGNLGLRMKRSFEDAFESGAASALIIGTDIPDLTHGNIQKAFQALEQKQLVLGPARDGGYYLIGLHRDLLSRAVPDLFTGIKWGKENVLDETLRAARRKGLGFTLLDVLGDVDRPEDLSLWEGAGIVNRQDFTAARISIIIPTLNEAESISKTLKSTGPGSSRELIVVDGGSDDETVPLAKSLGARVIDGSPPRSRQMNLGAAESAGDVLLFLHADTLLPEKFDDHILQSLKRPRIVAGAFELHIDSPNPALRYVEHLANWRSRHMGTPYGDQAIFLSSRIFHQMGGFSDFPIMEDFELVRRLKKGGKSSPYTHPF